VWFWKNKAAPLILAVAILTLVLPHNLIGASGANGDGLSFFTSESLEPYKVGALFAATGSNAALGNPQKQTVDMMVEQINATGGIGGHPLEVIAYDYESDAAKCSTLANKLIYDDNVTAIIGPTGTGDTNAILDMAKDAEIPLISCAAGAGIVTPYAAPATGNDRHWIFSTPQVSVMLVQRLYEYLNTENISRIAILTDAVGFGADGRNHLNGQAATYGITITADQTYGANDADMIAQLTLIKGTNPQAVVCWGRTPGSAIVAKNMTTLDMRDIPLFCSHSITLESFTTLAGDSANGVMFASGKLPVADYLVDSDPQKALLLKYQTDFNAKYGDGTANAFGGHAYDALSIVVEALKNAVQQDPGTINGSHDVLQAVRAEIRDYVEGYINSSGYPGAGGYSGVAGVFNMSPDNHNGLSRDSLVMIKIVDGDWTLVQAPPTITSVNPNQGNQGQSLAVTITGTDFAGATLVSFGTGIGVNSRTVDTDTRITANITVDAAATLGARDVSVTTHAGTATMAASFEVTQPPHANQPVSEPNNVSPANGATGINLTPTLQSSAFSDPDGGDTHAASQWQVTATAGNYSSPVFDSGTDTTHLTSMSIPVLSYVSTYYWHVRYEDNHGAWSSWSVETSFGTTSTPPAVATNDASSITTNSGKLNGDLTSLGTAGSVTVSFAWGTSSGSLTNETTGQAMTSTGVFYFDLASLTPGRTYYYKAKAVGHGAPVHGIEKSFATGRSPEVETLDPIDGKRKQHLTVTITGENFDGATGVSFGSGITVEDFSVNSRTEITAQITIDADAAKGTRDVSVTTGWGTGTKTDGFTIAGGGGGICSGGGLATPGAPSEMTTTLAALGLLLGMGYFLVRRGTRNRRESVRA